VRVRRVEEIFARVTRVAPCKASVDGDGQMVRSCRCPCAPPRYHPEVPGAPLPSRPGHPAKSTPPSREPPATEMFQAPGSLPPLRQAIRAVRPDASRRPGSRMHPALRCHGAPRRRGQDLILDLLPGAEAGRSHPSHQASEEPPDNPPDVGLPPHRFRPVRPSQARSSKIPSVHSARHLEGSISSIRSHHPVCGKQPRKRHGQDEADR